MKNLALAFLLFYSFTAFAVDKTVISDSPQGWGDASNWSPSGIPVNGDVVIIPAGQTISVKGTFYTGIETIIIKASGILAFNPSGKLELGINSQVQLLSSAAKLTSNGTGSEIIKIGGITKFDGSVDGQILSGPLYASRNTTSSPNGFSSSLTVLPIKLLSFSAAIANDAILIKWQTLEENNTKLFSLERSLNGSTYEPIGTVNAKGSGSTYQITEPLTFTGTHYYRLKTLDNDGRVEYSKIISLNNYKQLYSIVYSPATQNITLINRALSSDKSLVQLFDGAGTKVYQKQHSTGGSISIDVSTYKRCIYFVQINDQTERVILR